jgi:hypothetical protein
MTDTYLTQHQEAFTAMVKELLAYNERQELIEYVERLTSDLAAEASLSETDILGVPEWLAAIDRAGVEFERQELCFLIPEADIVEFAFWSRNDELISEASKIIRREKLYPDCVNDGFLRRAWLWFRDFDRVDSQTTTKEIGVTVGEIHCPHIPGCETQYSVTKAASFDVSIRSLGTRFGKIRKFTQADTLKVEARCSAIETIVELEIVPWKNRFTGELRYLVKVVAIPGELTPANLPDVATTAHLCNPDYALTRRRYTELRELGGAVLGRDFIPLAMKAVGSGVTKIKRWDLERGSAYSATVSIPIDMISGGTGGPSEFLGISVESRFSSAVGIEYKLVSGHDYLGVTSLVFSLLHKQDSSN